ncbi:MAG: sigma-70 family RNA polymerase sigma factor [Bacteroidetes bacterium]|nr:sigma-70 family RNA polymerase sigma factor [Bacteroidota bacterium]
MLLAGLSDLELTKQFINGCDDAFEVLINRHQRKIYSTIYVIVKNKELANDFFQDTFLKVIHTLKSGKYNEEGKFLQWTLRIARNLIIDYFRKRKKMPPLPIYKNENGEEINMFDLIETPDANGEELKQKKDIKLKIRTLVQELPFDQKEVVLMRMYYNMSFKEISELTGVSINTSLGRMRYALINLKKQISEEELLLI